MALAIITGSGGLIGSAAARHFAALGMDIVGVDNDMRREFFGPDASTRWNVDTLEKELGRQYTHCDTDIRDRAGMDELFERFGDAISVVIHAAAQPSHDWAARAPFVDFDINAVGTLNLLEATRRHCPSAPFIFMSTNKVYGDRPNLYPFVELESRYELPESHEYHDGFREDLSIDSCLHSLFGASKVAADVLVQEYGRYFDMPTVCFRGGTLTGPQHSAAELHGFLAYVMRCAMTGKPYTVYGYKGKQVRDAIHCDDVVRAFEWFVRRPTRGAVYNLGGGRSSNCSVLEAIALARELTGNEMSWTYNDENRIGDHIWWIGDNGAFRRDYPEWQTTHDVSSIMKELLEANADRWTR